MATIHSTIISGAGASSALLPLLAGKTSILLVTDKNVGALEATQAIHRLLAAEGREVEVIDSVPAGRQPAADGRWYRRGERTGCSKTAVSTSAP